MTHVGSSFKGHERFGVNFRFVSGSLGVTGSLAFGLTMDVFESISDTSILNKELPAEPAGNGEDVIFS